MVYHGSSRNQGQRTFRRVSVSRRFELSFRRRKLVKIEKPRVKKINWRVKATCEKRNPNERREEASSTLSATPRTTRRLRTIESRDQRRNDGKPDLPLSLEELVLQLLDLSFEVSVFLLASCKKLLDVRAFLPRVGSSSRRTCDHRDAEHTGSTRSDDDSTGRSESESAHVALASGE